MNELIKSWVTSANDEHTDFPLNNLPYGVYRANEGARLGVAIGDQILDVRNANDVLELIDPFVAAAPNWNPFMAAGSEVWAEFRAGLMEALKDGSDKQSALENALIPQKGATLLMPIEVAEYTDFYAGRNHAFNVGTMFRGPENALPPNWLHIPIGYNGRASSVVISGTDVRRPWGQLKGPNDEIPHFAPSKRFDIELEMGAIVGTPSQGPIGVDEADDNIFGYVLLNDWSARDIQAWEYQPLGPFQAKATATTISPWIITKDALEPFRVSTPPREVELIDYIKDTTPMLYDIALEVELETNGSKTILSKTNYKEMYYSAAQQLAHHTTSGCAMRVGDLLGSGTISGPTKPERGSLLELSWGGKEPITLDNGETRAFLEDGDCITLKGAALGNGYKIGFGDCIGKVIPALKDPYKPNKKA